MATKKKSEDSLKDFEKKIQQVETLIEKLRAGTGSLQESLQQYETGVGILKECAQAITAMEKRVALISQDDKGGVSETPFE